MPAGALDGLRVLDCTQMLAGPLAATRLGDLGADVIKIEPVATGEFNRTHGFEDLLIDGEMTTFVAVNRNKRSLAIDLKADGAAVAFRALVASADVFLQNFRPGVAARLGVSYEQLAAINPRIVYCSISGYGDEGPYRLRPGQDLLLQAYSGAMFSVGAEGDAPVPGALWAADVMTGYQAAIGILAALHHRERSGRGQHVEVDMFSVVLDTQLQELVTYLNTGSAPRRTKEASAHGSIPAPYGVYRTSDGWLALAMSPLPLLGELLDDDFLRGLVRYNDGHDHRDEVYRQIRHAFETATTAEWIRRSDELGVWAGPVYDYPMLAADPHVAATGMFVDQPNAHDGPPIKTVRPPLKLSETPTAIRKSAPALGQHSREVLREAGLAEDSIDALITTGAVREATP
ncbi:MAG TPA: CoA transferase [Propionibacteriaceae bacterium]|nr:CoA transferase [Micropruina sp.]HBX80272.1 CoA transferase [Propionibacteriaceae bacterium]HBY23820.1 CoA transferase [Propionibacteriaceae bacterium]